MKLTSKILCALLVLTMVFAMFSVSASAAATTITPTNGTAADITGIPTDATKLTYLSDAALATKEYNAAHPELGQTGAAKKDAVWDGQTLWFVYGNDGPGYNGVFAGGKCYVPGADGTPVLAETVGKDNSKCYLGKDAIEYEKAFGVNAGNEGADRKQIFLNNNSQYFYAVAGNNGANSTAGSASVTFEVWGSKAESYDSGKHDDAAFELLATADVKGFQVAEFNVDISEYKMVWLNVKYNGVASNGGRYGAWGNACFYSMPGATPAPENPKTADSFTMTSVAALIVAATSVTALVISKKKFF